jgi:hypothetical protein
MPVLALDRLWTHPGSILRELKAHNSALARVASDQRPPVATLDLWKIRGIMFRLANFAARRLRISQRE